MFFAKPRFATLAVLLTLNLLVVLVCLSTTSLGNWIIPNLLRLSPSSFKLALRLRVGFSFNIFILLPVPVVLPVATVWHRRRDAGGFKSHNALGLSEAQPPPRRRRRSFSLPVRFNDRNVSCGRKPLPTGGYTGRLQLLIHGHTGQCTAVRPAAATALAAAAANNTCDVPVYIQMPSVIHCWGT